MNPTVADIELKVLYFFGTGQNFVIPNVSYGFRLPQFSERSQYQEEDDIGF